MRVVGLEARLSEDFGRRAGLEFSLPFRISYSYTDAEFRNSFESDFDPWGDVVAGDKLPYLAPHQLYASFGLENDRWRLGIDANYVSEMRTVAGQGDIPDSQATDSFLVMNAYGEYQVGSSGARLFVNLQNIADSEYIVARRPAGARPGLPRTLMAGIKFRLTLSE